MGPSPEPEEVTQESIENSEPSQTMRIPSVNNVAHESQFPWSSSLRPPNDAAPGLDALSAAAAASHTGREEITRSPSAQSIPATNTLNFILNHPRSSQSSPIDPALVASSFQPIISNHEEAFLIRHFSETTGHW